MSEKFIPNGDLDFATMARGFASTIAKDPDKWTLSNFDAEQLSRRVKEFDDALRVARDPVRRTPSTIFIKDEKRKTAEEMIRRLANIIRASDQISTADKLSLWIKERPKKLGKRTVPFAAPVLQYLGEPRGAGPNSGLHLLRVSEGYSFINKSKPNGAVGVQIYVDLVMPGDPIPQYPGQFLGGRPWFLRLFTTNPIKVKHPVPPVPMEVVYWACWQDAKGNVGPFSQTCRARIEGGTGANTIGLVDQRLGPMPTITQLERDPKYITTITQLRQIEQLRVERLLPDSGNDGATSRALEDQSMPAAPKAMPTPPALPEAA